MNRLSSPLFSARVTRYLIPFYPLFALVISMKGTMNAGIAVSRQSWRSTADKKRAERVLTFNEALARRPADALPLEAVERLCWKRKRLALIGVFFALCSLGGSVLGGHFLSAGMSLFALSYCVLRLVQYAHRAWQIERGRRRPDCPLEGLREFFAQPKVGWYVLNPKLFD